MPRRRPAAAAPRQPAIVEKPLSLAGAAGPAFIEMAKSMAAAAMMCVLVVAVYFPVRSRPADNTLFASDYHQLHIRRIHFAQQALSTTGHLPAWYPRELMGTPFWSNVQDFPFIPTRLVLLWMDPLELITAGVLLAAILAALFTFLFARSLGVGRVGAAAAGWTFACAGFFASRVMAGHLPLLEAYPALPLLLWRVELCVGEGREIIGKRLAVRLAVLAIATCCVMLAGHPQLPVYAVGVAGLYALYRGWRRRPLMLRTVAAIALGGACAAFALWPMFQLVGRSTRVLPLDPAANDLAMPYRRLIAFLLPWHDGWPEQVLSPTPHPFTGYDGGENLFWDSVCYVGWQPLAAVLFLTARQAVRRRQLPRGAWLFIGLLGMLSLLAALPAAQDVTRMIPGTLLRSPARLLYLTTFALAIGAGVAADVLLRHALSSTIAGRAVRIALGSVLVVLLVAHGVDLGVHDRAFIRMIAVPTLHDAQFEQAVRRYVGDGRVGIDFTLTLPLNREIDDVGFFESIMLAKPYAALADLSGVPPTTNVQHVDGSELPVRALASTGTRLVISTQRDRPDLRLVSGNSKLRSYAVPNPLPRAAFYPVESVTRLDAGEIHKRLRDPSYDVGSGVMLDRDTSPSAVAAAAAPTTSPATSTPAPVAYQRPSSDAIVLRAEPPVPGVLRVLESWDPGWRATIDGTPADVLCADDVFLAVALPPGPHEVKFTYATPGVATGIGISLASLCLLAALATSTARAKLQAPEIDKRSA
jgi:hypothetical protein